MEPQVGGGRGQAGLNHRGGGGGGGLLGGGMTMGGGGCAYAGATA